MKITAIICEYNPMTNGHLNHMKIAREETGADTILLVMSGSFVQRGDAAIADKYIRAEVAARLGADIVVELPTIYAISPADNFAYGAVKTIAEFPGVDYISFGSETGCSESLKAAAKILSEEPSDFKELLQSNLKEGYSFPKARALAFNAFCEKAEELNRLIGILDEPNNVLGISYILALEKLAPHINIHTVKRVGGGYNDDGIESEYPSATAVREAVRRGEINLIKNSVPLDVYAYLLKLNTNSTSLSDMALFKLKSISGYDLEKYYDISGGIHNRIKLAAAEATSLTDLLEKAKTKKYTMARLKRICLYALFDITQEMYDTLTSLPPYIQILALKKDRKDILSELSERTSNVLTRYSDIDKVDKRLRQFIKLDFQAQGTLEIINRSNYFNKKMLLVD